MPQMVQIEAILIPPVVAQGNTRQTAALEIVSKTGDQFLIVLSGEGMKELLQEIQTFLEENPEIEEWKSEPRQS
jgi:hypothetical protein